MRPQSRFMRPDSSGIGDALQALRRPRAKPRSIVEPSVFPGRRVKPLPGQLDLEGNEVGRR